MDTFRMSQASGTLYWLVVGAAPFLLPLLLETRLCIKPATTPLINRFGFRALLLASTVVEAFRLRREIAGEEHLERRPA